MPDLPSGTITFLFTDIQGSTRLWEQYPQQMQQALARHGELAGQCVEAHGGIFVRTRGEGDSTFSVFPVAADALAAACAFQRALAAESWPTEAPIRVRAALHTGTATLRENDYNSSDVNRCARLRAIAHGEQTVLSQTVYDLAHASLPDGVTLRDLGRHRLKDLQEPEHVYQLCHSDLRADFPPLLSLENFPTNLPRQLTTFVGRQQEIQTVQELLAGAPLLTLTGTGGCGKTRLALQVAAAIVEDYPDGVWLVELAALSEANLVPQTVAFALGLREESGRALIETLIEYLRSKSLLLLLDNCEHLVEACAQLCNVLLRSCPQVKILATSREALNIAGEGTYRVPSLLMPDLALLPKEEKEIAPILLEYDAVRLFVERAQTHRSDFMLTRQNGLVVAEVCHRLDGIPLALELAAARIRALPLDQLAARLDDRFRLLSGGSRTALPRQQTLRALIDWSYDLLSDKERLLLQRLSVFAGGWGLEAAEAVCCGEREQRLEKGAASSAPTSETATLAQTLHSDDVLDLLTSLVDKSLIVFEERKSAAEGRYHLLETIRQYGQERLAETREGSVLRSRHRDYFLAMAEEAESQLAGPQQGMWLERLEGEHDNLRAALEWCKEDGAEAGLRLAGALVRFWSVRSYLSEGREHIGTVLSRRMGQERTQEYARAFHGAGILAYLQGDYRYAEISHEESLAIYRELDDKQGIALSLQKLGNVIQYQGDYESARAIFAESLRIYGELGDKQGIANTLACLGEVARMQSDYVAARIYQQESLGIMQELGNKWGIAVVLNNFGCIAREQRNYGEAMTFHEESLAIMRELGDKRGISHSLHNLGIVAYDQRDYEAAKALHEESLAIMRQMGDKRGIIFTLDAFARIAIAVDLSERAVQLWGITEVQRELIGLPISPNDRVSYDRNQAAAREALGEEAFSAAWAEGCSMTLDQAIAYALDD